MGINHFRALAAVIVTASFVVTACAGPKHPASETQVPTPHVGFDYQIGGPYHPPSGVSVVSRDHTADPAVGLYNICYVNAFQTQPGAERDWDPTLLLHDASGAVVIDPDWNEALLDLTTAAKRQRIAAIVNNWIDTCAAKGFQAVEPDNFDSYTRSRNLLTSDEAQQYIRLLSAHAHDRGLAIAQKNTAELADNRRRNGLDFAIAEECAENDECATYADAFDNHVEVIEYTDHGLAEACSRFGDRLSIIERDKQVSTPDNEEYLRKTC
ncbi:endo alpha-1,4 polygalactosaminidase [Nocardia macrotermitis]|uniref:Glycoside-hydrolase family GH114 TIM-barrel domain-containing protein n=1 Tax=Nocardia macrotermitis TaxID=2585198 RepID=A0A7K0DAD0_9NOCA|nr:endo alpha-1,4 polygalactosaminidase [Nocardia macrotermitis]MQY22282.1 hypothetical protein [Nocardia macrotermitis]